MTTRFWAGLAAAFHLAALPVIAMGQAIPSQAWYPAGYLDMRIAAARQAEEFPRPPGNILFEDFDDPKVKTYDVIDCNLAYDLPYDMDPVERALGSLALDIARMRYEFADLGYSAEVYDAPLLAYERAMLEGMPSREAVEAEARKLDPSSEDYDGWSTSEEEEREWELQQTLAVDLDERRRALNPRLPRIVREGGCGAGESEFAIRLQPANGELWLINAFAFRVCERKVADPWNHRACGWTQYVEGDTTFASGRYMYEARWGATVKRGARLLEGDPGDDDVTQITFRR